MRNSKRGYGIFGRSGDCSLKFKKWGIIMKVIDLKGRCNTQIEVQMVSRCRYFFSFQVLIAKKDHVGKVWLNKEKWDYSKTTLKYLGRFLGEKTKEIRFKVKDGKYKLCNPVEFQEETYYE
jgi:hypothetical protein